MLTSPLICGSYKDVKMAQLILCDDNMYIIIEVWYPHESQKTQLQQYQWKYFTDNAIFQKGILPWYYQKHSA